MPIWVIFQNSIIYRHGWLNFIKDIHIWSVSIRKDHYVTISASPYTIITIVRHKSSSPSTSYNLSSMHSSHVNFTHKVLLHCLNFQTHIINPTYNTDSIKTVKYVYITWDPNKSSKMQQIWEITDHPGRRGKYTNE